MKQIKKCPESGEGVHQWLYYAACAKLENGDTDSGALGSWLEANMSRPPTGSTEIPDAIQSAERSVFGDSNLGIEIKRAPVYSPTASKVMASKGPEDALEFLRESSPIKGASTGEFLRALYEPGETCVLLDKLFGPGVPYNPHEGDPEPPNLGSEEGVYFLTNPVTGDAHTKGDGRQSIRCEECLTSYRYMLIESDKIPKPRQAQIIAALPRTKLVSVVDSAGKSLHAIVRVDAKDEAEWAEIAQSFKCLKRVGMDDGVLSAVRLSRLPGYTRQGKMQELIYLNPNPKKGPIYLN